MLELSRLIKWKLLFVCFMGCWTFSFIISYEHLTWGGFQK
jgi:hypothetical protein